MTANAKLPYSIQPELPIWDKQEIPDLHDVLRHSMLVCGCGVAIYVRKRSDSLRADSLVSCVHTLKTLKMFTVQLVFAAVMVSLPGSQSQPTGVQCSSAVTQFNMVQQEPIQEYCQEIQNRFNDTAYRIDFTQSEVDQICNDDVCVGVLQQLVISCNTFVS